MSKGVRLLVRGRVQGVGFRWYVHREARQIGVVGGVRNLWDGRVEVHAEGDEPDLTELIERVRQGPSGSGVAGVEEHWEAPSGGFVTFEIWPTR